MLYPREDPTKNELIFACGMCDHHESSNQKCVWRHELSNTVGETAGITQDVAADPSVGALLPPDPLSFILQETSPAIASASNDHRDNNVPDGTPANEHDKKNSIGGLEQLLSQSFLNDTTAPAMCCTMCGQEITCNICGQPTENGVWLEVDGDNNEHTFMSDVSEAEDEDDSFHSPSWQHVEFVDHGLNLDYDYTASSNEPATEQIMAS